ncbi:Ribonuclease 3-like protein 3 [Nymphaea thermarum]|nr:Ribonuclease 3-like protein 3 [Nymphaea thermarum]
MEGTPDAPPEDDFSQIVDRVQEKLQYRFADRELVRGALTHGSYYYPLKGGVCYERLEFIGDSVLNFLVSDHLVKLYPGLSPGQLTLLRSANTDTEKLARVAFRHGLHKLLRHKVTILEQQVFRKMLEPFITLETLGKHPVSELHEYCQKKGISVTFVRCEWKCGSRVQVWLEGQLMGVGSCNKKEGAKNRAAKAALANLKKSEHIQDEAIESPSSS